MSIIMLLPYRRAAFDAEQLGIAEKAIAVYGYISREYGLDIELSSQILQELWVGWVYVAWRHPGRIYYRQIRQLADLAPNASSNPVIDVGLRTFLSHEGQYCNCLATSEKAGVEGVRTCFAHGRRPCT